VNAPKRLLEDPATAEALRADLQAAANHQLAYDVSAGLARFEATLANAGAVGGSAGALKSALVKLGVVGAVGGVIAAVALYSGQQPDTLPQATGVEEAPSAPVKPALEPRVPPPARQAEPPRQVEPAPSQSHEPRSAPAPKRALPRPQTIAPTAEPSRSVLLAQEVAQLRKIRQTLPGNPAQALQWANEGHAEFRKGVLYQEREALALQALSALGRRAELERRGARYLEAFPQGSFSGQVRQLLDQ